MVVAERDTILEVTTIHIQTNEVGDTIARSMVTDRTRARSRDAIATQRTKTEVRVDTVYIEKRDSVMVQDSRFMVSGPEKRGSALVSALKWIFWIIVSVTVLFIILKLRRF